MKIFDTLSNSYKLLNKKNISIYACGVTVYDNVHIGHARLYICIDVLLRVLKYKNISFNYVRNITDIDDKIINKANSQNTHFSNISNKYIQEMQMDFDGLGLIKPNKEPKATESISEIIELISSLVEKGFAYKANNNDILFNVKKFAEYGKLSNRDLNNQIQQQRMLNKTENAEDFTLWKVDKIKEPFWNSPFGPGRPGWHIECSAMIKKELGKTIDIHAGGEDLKFPHHENEIAQSESCFNEELAKIWMHVGHLNISGEKMSKSLGNFIKVKDILKKFHKDSIRLALLTAQYKKQQDFVLQQIEQADKLLFNVYRLSLKPASNQYELVSIEGKEFIKYLLDDLNTPVAIEQIHKLVGVIENTKDKEKLITYKNDLFTMAKILGVNPNDKSSFFRFGFTKENIVKVDSMIEARNLARNNKDWDLADSIRDEIISLKVSIYDEQNTTWWSRTIL